MDKIRFLSLTDKSALEATEELSIKIKADKEAGVLHVTDTGIGKLWITYCTYACVCVCVCIVCVYVCVVCVRVHVLCNVYTFVYMYMCTNILYAITTIQCHL